MNEINDKNNNLNPKSLLKCLSDCEFGTEVKILEVNAGSTAKMRLADLGVVPGVSIIKKRSAPFRGPVEILIKSTSLVLGRGLANKIIVDCGNCCKL